MAASGGGGGNAHEGPSWPAVSGDPGLQSSLDLPQNLAFRNLKHAKLLALDIGGSLAKIAYYSVLPVKRSTAGQVETCEGARLHFIKFETRQIGKCLDFIAGETISNSISRIYVTGGGAYKFENLIQSKLGLKVVKVDEMKSICSGANFLLTNIPDESFTYDRTQVPHYNFKSVPAREELYPYLLVTIGSGVSIIKIDSELKFERIGGTATGGGTFWGLGRLLTGAQGFDELLEMATQGDFRQADMLVKDIYGDRDDYRSLGLGPDVIASSFGKAIHKDDMGMNDKVRSLLYMVSNDIGQIATLYAMLHNVKRIVFGGFFLRHHPVSLHTISYAVNYWSKGNVRPHFLRHEGYLGAIGAFLDGCQSSMGEYSWTENLYASSSSFPSANTSKPNEEPNELEVTDHLEIDRYDTLLGYCPLLEDGGSGYVADTVDLTGDDEARTYWLSCFEDSLPKFADRAVQSQVGESENVLSRVQEFKKVFLSRISSLRDQPYAHGSLTVRNLLDMREQCLSEYGFHDPYLKQKMMENNQAFEIFGGYLESLRSLSPKEKIEKLSVGFLAGNVFDWGAKEVALLMDEGLEFQQALKLVGPRPWLVDDLERWTERLMKGPIHRCVSIFIDNSGVDVVLGVLPMVEFLLERGTRVLLCANNKPVLNDVTYDELLEIVQRASRVSKIIKRAAEEQMLECFNSGQSSACLDLSRLSQTLIMAMIEREVDLIILEGMGRAIHTNLSAKFTCESLKVAVIKNRWLAKRLGGDMYSVIFKYENPKL